MTTMKEDRAGDRYAVVLGKQQSAVVVYGHRFRQHAKVAPGLYRYAQSFSRHDVEGVKLLDIVPALCLTNLHAAPLRLADITAATAGESCEDHVEISAELVRVDHSDLVRCPSGAAGCIANLEVIHLSLAAQLI